MQIQQIKINEKTGSPGARSPYRHHWKNLFDHVPRKKPENAFALIVQLICVENSPNINQILFKIFQGRASIEALRSWRYGRRKAPLWAKQFLAEKLRAKIAELNQALKDIEG